MMTLPSAEIEQRGFRALSDALKDGPVHVLEDGVARYVILDAADYAELMKEHDEALSERIQEALDDVVMGRVTRSTAQEIIDEFGLSR